VIHIYELQVMLQLSFFPVANEVVTEIFSIASEDATNKNSPNH
jgi:hypothetical protein